jgi:Holliday junction resolvase
MGSKRKGTLYERELFHMFWDKNWAAIRAAGSGSTPLPSPDLIAGNQKKLLAIECKSLKTKSKHFNNEEISQLKRFSALINATPIIAMRFNNVGWYFLDANKLEKNKGGNYTITLDLCKKKGIKFEELVNNEAIYNNTCNATNNL